MKATLILADAASAHPDGTFSLLRGGITECYGPASKVVFRGALILRAMPEAGEVGEHRFKIVCITADGQPVGAEIEGGFTVPKIGAAAHVVLNMQILLPNYGRYEFIVTINKHQAATWPLEAKAPPPAQKPALPGQVS